MKAMLAASVAAFTLLAMPLIGAATAEAQSQSAEPGPVATTALVREIQFMLLTIGIDPGPIDGNPRQLTNRAVHIFQQRSGLPEADLVEQRTGLAGFPRTAAGGGSPGDVEAGTVILGIPATSDRGAAAASDPVFCPVARSVCFVHLQCRRFPGRRATIHAAIVP